MENHSESTMIRLTLPLIPNAFDSSTLNSLLELLSCANSLERANTVRLSNIEDYDKKWEHRQFVYCHESKHIR